MKANFKQNGTLIRAWGLALVCGAYSALALLKNYPPFTYVPEIPLALDGVVAFIMALLMAFRVNRAYERWWEGRTLWGRLVNVSRNLAVKVKELPRVSADELRAVRDLIVAFSFGLKDHLRDSANLRSLPGFEADDSSPAHVPSHIVRLLYARFAHWHENGKLTGEQLWILDAEARWLLEVCGGCERIKTTPMPPSWSRITEKSIILFLLVQPWGMVDDFGMWTIPLAIIIAYLVITAELAARHVEQPFDTRGDHLELEGVCRAIDTSVSQILVDQGEV